MNRRTAAATLGALLALAASLQADCRVAESGGRVTLENRYVRLVLAPARGGKCASFVFKGAEQDLTSWPNYGSIEDRRWGPKGYERLRNYPYQAKVTARGPDRVCVALSSRCTVPGFTALTVEKTVTLRRGESSVRVRYRWRNGSKVTLPLGWWFFQDLAVQGKKNTFYAPTPFGVEKSVHVPGKGQTSERFGRTADRFLYDVPRAWSAVIGETGVGAVATFDLKRTCFIYNFANQHETTLEWAFNQIDLGPGKTSETEFLLFPVAGLPTVDGAGEDLAGSLTTPGRENAFRKPARFAAGERVPVAVAVVGCRTETVTARVEARAWPDGAWRRVGERALALTPGKAAKATFATQPTTRATTVLRCVVLRGGKPVFDMERPIVYGNATGEYTLKPAAAKVGKELGYFRPKRKASAPRETVVTLPEDYQPTRKVVTPHIKWAVPWAGGKVRVFAPMHHRIMRQLVEFAQRADIDYDTIAMDTYKGKLSSAEMTLLLSRLKAAKYDVIILGDYNWNRLPKGIQSTIMGQVSGGKGLVIVGATARLPRRGKLRDAFVDAGTLEALQPKRIRLYKHGKGRIAAAPYRAVFKGGLFAPSPVYHARYVKPVLTQYSNDFSYWEYSYALCARLMLWAAGKTPDVAIDVRAETPAADRFAVTLTNTGKAAVSGTLELTLTDRWSKVLGRVTRPVKLGAGRQVVTLGVPPLPAGPIVADVWLKRGDGAVVTWATKAITVPGPVKIGPITLDRGLYADGDTVRAVVPLEIAEGGPAGLALKWRLTDCFRRLLARGEAKPRAATVRLAVPISRALARYCNLHVEAVRGGRVVAAQRVGFAVKPIPRPYPFYFMNYGSSTPRYREKFGCNTGFGGGERGMLRTRNGTDLIAWSGIHRRFRVQASGKERVRPGCLSDPKFREECKKGIDNWARWGKLQGNLGILIADEWGYGGEGNRNSNYCHSPSCVTGFRGFLKKEYGTIQALNRSWGTAYRSWDQIVPPTFDETRKSGKWERWTDHRRWVETLVADFFGFCVGYARKTYPEARIGFSGTPNAGSFNGYDWSKLCKTMNIICSYGGPQGETLRSFKRPKSFTSAWGGYDRKARNEKRHRLHPWFALFNDMDGLGYYTSSYAPLHNPDWTWNKKAHWIAEQWRDLRGGIATLIRNGKRVNDGIAIHYSQSSIHGATRQNRYEQFGHVLTSLCQMLEDLGLQYDFVAYGDIERGKLRRGYRLLIMPYSQAVSRKEAQEIAAFVRAGGAVIADIYPAVRDQHGKAYAHGALDEVFGVRSAATDEPTLRLTTIAGDKVPAGVQLPGGCAKLKVSTGRAQARLAEMDGAPAWIVRRHGAGRAVLLNFTFIGYSGYRPGGTGGEIAIVEQAKQKVRLAVSGLGRALLRDVGVTPGVRITRRDGSPCLDAEIVRYRQGAATYVGVLPSAVPGGLITKADTEAVSIDFGAPAYVYELRSRKRFGRTRQFATKITRGVAKVYALMPAGVAPLQVKVVGAPSRKDGVRLSLRTNDATSDHVAHISVFRPDGGRVRLYERDVILTGGKGLWTVPLALNDPGGTWRIEARDVAEGSVVKVPFRLPPP